MRIVALSTLLCVCALSGCNVARALERFTSPDEVIKARFHPADVPTVVFIDDRRNEVNPVRLRREIADTITNILIDEAEMTAMISPRDAMAAARRLDNATTTTSIGGIGAAVGASQVIYVEVVAFRITRDGLTPDPMAYFNVRVLDLETGTRAFPTEDRYADSAGYPVQATVGQTELVSLTGRGSASGVRQALATQAGDTIARLFVDTGYGAGGEQLIDVNQGQ